MMRRVAMAIGGFLLATCGSSESDSSSSPLQPEPLRSGSTFLTAETLALQEDDFANPGFLWVDRGRTLFQSSSIEAASCGSCHGAEGEDLFGAAAHYPSWDDSAGQLLNIEQRINACRVQHQNLSPLEYESDDLLSLTSFVSSLSKGSPVSVRVTPETQGAFDRGRDYFFTRRGQFNLSCAQCHNDNWGKRLRGDTISQGHGNGFPAYRLEWQSLGSLHRRLQDCDSGVRAEPMALGSDTYVELELYLAARASGLEIETPGVRR